MLASPEGNQHRYQLVSVFQSLTQIQTNPHANLKKITIFMLQEIRNYAIF